MGKFRTWDSVPTQGNQNEIACQTCGDKVLREGIYRKGNVVHCEGLSWAFGVRVTRGEHHHAARLHPQCWRCRSDLGCERCSGGFADLLCSNTKYHGKLGHVWATREALIEHGVLRNQTIDDYPPEWKPAYMQTMEAARGAVRSLEALVRQVAAK